MPFEVGVTFPAEDLNFLPRVEELGFDSVWTSEHILFYGPTLDATVTLGAFAARTARVKLGTPEQTAERLRVFVDAGVRHMILVPITPPGATREHLKLYARELLPADRG